MTEHTHAGLWAILPDALDGFVSMVASGRKAVEAGASRQAIGQEAGYRIDASDDGNVAIVPVSGVMMKSPDIFDVLFGGAVGTVDIEDRIREAASDPDVDAIVIDFDSPGGQVDGTDTLAKAIRHVSDYALPVVTHTDGMLTSAAYWAGSAADRIVAGETSRVGSIGVIAAHVDVSGMYQKIGLKKTYIAAGREKAYGNEAEPLSESAREKIQNQVNTTYGIFVNAVSRHRGVDAEMVKERMAEGRVFIGRQAQDAGLVDEVGTLADAISLARDLMKSPDKIYEKKEKPTMKREDIKTLSDLQGMFPDLVQEAVDQGAKGVDLEGAKAEGAQAEQARILALADVQFGKNAEKLRAVVASGVTPEQFQAIIAAQAPAQEPPAAPADPKADAKAQRLAAIQASGAPNVGSAPVDPPKDYLAMVREYKAAHNCKTHEAHAAVMKDHPDLHAQYIQAAQAQR